jgi:lipopolysaccharide/colanic/teichoic acid biosynthesis glycosyltransferase
MRQDAEAGGKAIWAQERDPRITRVGQFLRQSRIDEIPQAWNVLRGEMSFVGPRPERPEFVKELEAQIPYYAERHMVKPGLTGWAQVNYPYGASIEDARAKLEYDLYYAKNYTPFLDLLILLQTVRVVLWPEGAR